MKRFLSLLLLLVVSGPVMAQDDLLALAEADSAAATAATATFKGTRIINGHSVELIPQKELLFLISHRFGMVNSGAYNFFGLDNATIRLALEYGLTKRLNVGVGRSSLQKTYDGYLKYRLLNQLSEGWRQPLTVTALTSIAVKTLEFANPERDNHFSSRLFYTYQLLLARKFNEHFSLQLSPTLVHRNLVARVRDENNVLALGAGARYKLTKRISLNGEYYYLLPGATADDYRNVLSAGFDIETGGHVFQLHLTNAQGMIEKFFIPETTGRWSGGDIYFGFNISRIFDLGPDRESKNKKY
ncbi:MAG: DUF5777 family beta-barrel protein [Adhaeribacter sp.]